MEDMIRLNSLLCLLQQQAQNGNLEDAQIETLIESVKSAHDKDIDKCLFYRCQSVYNK